MHPVLALFAPDYEIKRRQRQTRGGIHRPDDGNPTHGGVIVGISLGFTSMADMSLAFLFGFFEPKFQDFLRNLSRVIETMSPKVKMVSFVPDEDRGEARFADTTVSPHHKLLGSLPARAGARRYSADRQCAVTPLAGRFLTRQRPRVQRETNVPQPID